MTFGSSFFPCNLMSNFDLLTKEEDVAAAAQGWNVYHVYELEAQKWVIRVLPAEVVPGVINLAKQGNPLAIKALRLVMHGQGAK